MANNHPASISALTPFDPMFFTGGVFPINGTGTGFILPTGKTITIKFSVTLNNPPNVAVPSTPQVQNHGTLSGGFAGNPLDTNTITTVVDLFDTATTLAPVSGPLNSGQSVTFTATIAATGSPSGSGTNRTGTVNFKDGGTPITGCAAQTVGAVTPNQATCTTSFSTLGGHSITAVYSGDGNFETSTTVTPSVQTVAKSNTTTAVTLSSLNPSLVTQNVTFTAAVTSSSSFAGPPTGTITFIDGVTTICNTVAMAAGSAQCSISTLTAGAHNIKVVYSGDTNFNASDNSASLFVQNVNKSDTSTALATSGTPVTPTTTVTYTATVSSTTAVTGPPTGSVTFKDNNVSFLCTGGNQNLTAGVATCQIAYGDTTGSPHSITAIYNGDTTFNASPASNTVIETVSQTATTTALVSSQNPSAPTNPVTFTATVSSSSVTGTVTFKDNGVTISCAAGSQALTSGVATCIAAANTLSQATHPITAVYSGDAVFSGSTSNTVNQVVSACSATVVVINTSDSGAGSLRQAIIDVCPGGTITFDPVVTSIPLASQLEINKSLSITGPGASALTVSGNNVTNIFVVDTGNTVTISGMTISNGKSVGVAGPGVRNDGTLTLDKVVVTGNTATVATDGGGIYNQGALTITNSTISNNTEAIGGFGAGIESAGAAATVMMINCTVSGNTGGSEGGGIRNSGGTFTIINSTISGNSVNFGAVPADATGQGGGIYNNATLIVTNSTISGNNANADGGGIFNTATGTATLTSVTVTGNSADSDNNASGTGGGIDVAGGGTVTLKNTIVAGNLNGTGVLQVETATVAEATPGTLTAGNASVVVTAAGMTGSPKTVSVTLATNDDEATVASKIRAALTADTAVNGFFTVSGAGAAVVLTARTVAANDATLNIAISDNTSVGLAPAPTSANTTPGKAADDIAGSINTAASASTFNLIGDAASSGGLADGTDNNIVGVASLGTRPITTILNSLLANNGGPTKTHALATNSPALESGNAFTLTTDQRGFTRPVNLADIGAYEQQVKPAAPTAPDLDAASDTGPSPTDNITGDTSPTFTIAGVISGATVDLLRDGNPVPVASGIAGGTSIQLTDPSASAGTYIYTAQQTLGGAPTSDPSAGLSVTIDNSVPPTPGTPDLVDASDTGLSITDNITSDTTPTFNITSVTSGFTVDLLRDGNPVTGTPVVVISGVAAGATIQLTDPSAPAGTYTYTSRQTNGIGNATSSAAALTVVIDTTPPFAPGTPDLQAASDSFGSTGSNTDNITNVASRSFDIPSTTNLVRVELYQGATMVVFGTGNGATLTLVDSSTNGDNTYAYTARQVDTAGNFAASGALNVTIDMTATAAGVPDLKPASDSGVSNTDNNTNVVSRSFDIGSTQNGSLVELLRGGAPVASTTGTGVTVTLIDNTVGDGTFAITSRQTDVAGNAASSAVLQVTIDQTPDAPGIPDLQDASDRGVSNIDNRTDNGTRIFDIGSQSGDLVELLRNGAPVSSTTALGASVSLSDTASPVDGPYTYTARQTDVAGNIATSAGLVVTIDTTAPTVASDVRASANPTAAATVNFTVTFSEAVTGVDTADFAATGSGGVTGASVATVTPIDSSHYTVTVNTGSGDGSLRLDVIGNGTIMDAMNLVFAANFTTGEVYTVDRSNPTVVSINKAGSNPTNAASVQFTVTFSEPVTGVDIGDFTLTTTGVAGASITAGGVAGSGATWTVTVNTGTGNGTIRLDLVDNDSIIDLTNKPLAGVLDGSFNTGQIYNVDKTQPGVTINQRSTAPAQADPVTGPTASTVINFTAVFSEPIVAGSFTNSDVAISGTALATVVNVSEVAPNNGTTFNVAVNGMTTSGTVIVDIPANRLRRRR